MKASLAVLVLFLSSSLFMCSAAESMLETPPLLDDSYAKYLFMEKDYPRAAGEFKRLAFYSADDSTRLASQLWVSRSEGYAGNRVASMQYGSHVVQYSTDYPELRSKARLQLGLTALENHDLITAATHFHGIDQNTTEAQLSQLFSISIYIWQRDFEPAFELVKSLRDSSMFDNTGALAYNIVSSSQSTPTKSPLLAGLFSAVIPGAGQLYCNHPVDGFQALIFDSIFIAAAAVAWSNNPSSPDALTIMATGTAAAVHGANIVGATRTASYRNYRIRFDGYEESLQLSKRVYLEELNRELISEQSP